MTSRQVPMTRNNENRNDLVERFFCHSGHIPSSVQSDYREAFELKYNCQPEDNPTEFERYVNSQIRHDSYLRGLLDNMEKGGRGGRKEIKSRSSIPPEISNGEENINPSEIIELENEKKGIIYSKRDGLESMLKILNNMKKQYHRCQFLDETKHNSHLGCTPGCLSGCRSVVTVDIEKQAYLNKINEHPLFDGNHEVYSDALTLRCRYLCQLLLESLDDRDLNFGNPCQVNATPSLFLGRFMRDIENIQDPKKFKYSGLLEPFIPPDFSIGKEPVQLVLNSLQSYAVFPGQTIAVIGVSKLDNNSHGRILPSEIISGLDIPKPLIDTKRLIAFDSAISNSPIHIVITAGPFTTSNSFDTTLLDRFIAKIEADIPHVLILLGPFVDSKNKLVLTDAPMLFCAADKSKYLSHDALYVLILSRIVFSKALKRTLVLVIPSTSDIGHPYPLPQPPLNFEKFFGEQPPKNVLFLSNPCNLTLSDIFNISITSTDPINPIVQELDSTANAVERISIAHSLVLRQRSFFPFHPLPDPVHPSHLNFSPCIWADDERIPHLLIYTSQTAPGIRFVGGRAFINTGRLTSSSKPCFCQLWIHSGKELNEEEQISDLELNKRLRVDLSEWTQANG